MVDTGFDQPVGTRRGRTVITPINEGLKRLGVEPDKIEDIIISHMHYDHCGNIDMFPRARYHVQDKEMHFCTGRCMCHKQLRNSDARRTFVAWQAWPCQMIPLSGSLPCNRERSKP